MAYWLLKSKARNGRTLILTPKCASTSIRYSITHRIGHKAAQPLEDGNIGICIRHPADRLRSVLTDTKTMAAIKSHGGPKTLEQALDGVEAGEPMHNHIAPMVDSLNFRYNKRDDCTHCPVPNEGGELHFTPAFVFIYEQLPNAWEQLLAWLGHPPVALKWKKKRDQEPPPNLAELAERIRTVYAKDFRLYKSYAKAKA